MLISSVLSIIISAIVANFHILGLGQYYPGQIFDRNGMVLGAAESEDEPGSAGQGDQYNPGTLSGTPTAVPLGTGFAKNLADTLVEIEKRAPGRLAVDEANRAGQVFVPPGPKKKGAEKIDILAKSGIVIDKETDKILFYKEADDVLAIASISKLMTAMVWLDQKIDQEQIYQISARDKAEGGKIILYPGDELKLKDLFLLSLVGSDNMATLALVYSTGKTLPDFVRAMNDKAKALGLEKTVFYDPIGLNTKNVSTAKEVAALAKAALDIRDIREAVMRKSHTCKTLQGRTKTLKSTDMILDMDLPKNISLLGGKTGYNEAANYCFVGLFSDPEGHEIIITVLNDTSKSSRFTNALRLADWTYENYGWK